MTCRICGGPSLGPICGDGGCQAMYRTWKAGKRALRAKSFAASVERRADRVMRGMDRAILSQV
jgi:hypothetical protein